ncbi:efflux RND transporter permease subunit [Treponema zioleckii]|uniref:efflux RND transporter permease subunit n=1 Tax=Treponema zioleckii TaxID=331680 RepID=UPI00168A8035|nr:efflux RND transporter permease subunit [Treponema zioleckii]
MSISKKVLEHPVLTACAFGLIVVVALFTVGNIKIDLMPDMTMPVAMVSTTYNNAGPESVEKSVTEVLESGLVSVSNLKSMTSTSSEGSSVIKLEFNYGTDIDVAVNNIRDKLDRVKGSLPDDCDSPQIFQFDSSSMPVMTLAVNGNRTAEELRKIADDQIADRLEQAPGVASASVSGGRDSIVRVELEQNRLDAYELTLSSIISTLAAQNLEVGGGSVSEGTRKYMVRTTGEFDSLEEINNTVVGTLNGYDVKLSDVGKAYMGYEDETSRIYINGKAGVYVQVQKQSGSNTVNVANSVYEKLEQIKKTLPKDVSIEIISDDSTSVRDTLKELIKSIIEGFVLAVIILFLFLRSAKSTLIMAISIPFCILLTLLIMIFSGITLNMITMTGLILGLGMVVDASVVVLENIYVYRNRGTESKTAAAIGTQEVMSSVISGNLTTICVFVPFFVYKSKLNMIGELFSSLMTVIIIALISSLFVAMFLVPVLAGKFLPVDNRKETPIKNKFLASADRKIEGVINFVTEKYRRALHFVLRRRFATIVIAFGILATAIAAFGQIRISFMSSYADSSVGLNVQLPLGTKLEETQAVLDDFYEIVRNEVKGYKNIVVSVGTGSGMSLSSDTSYKGSISIYLPDASEQIDSAETIKAKLRKYFDKYPVATFTFDEGRMRQMTGSDIDIAFRSNNMDGSLELANKIKKLISEKVPEVVEPEIDLDDGLPQIEIKIDRARASSFGLTVTSIANEINYSINGKTATTFRKDGEDYDVVVLLADQDRGEIPDLEKIFVEGSNGRYAVANFASVVRGTGPVSITREEQTRIIHLTANTVGSANAGEVEATIKSLIDESIVIPDDISVSFEGSWGDTKDTAMVFIVIVILAVILVFGVMAGTYESFKDPFINLFTLPFLIVGVVAIHLLTGQSFSMVSMIGIVMLVGIVVNNGIILVDQTNLLVRRGVKVLDACEQAGASRLRPVMMTTLTTILAMIPMAFFAGESGSMTQPIGLCVVGGLTSSTLVTLFIIPVIYSLFNKGADEKTQEGISPKLIEEFKKIDAEEK